MAFTDNVGTLVDTIVVVVVVIGACILDLFHNPCNHPRPFVNRRFLNWFLVGITYASTYFGRYNMNVVNQPQTHKDLGVTASQFGVVLMVGNISYAIFVVVNGFVVDKIGGSRAMFIGAFGSGFFNLVQGLFVYFATGHVTGNKALAVMCIIYALNNFFQTFCTSAICKVAVNWYNITERGYFSGIFGVIISLGFFFAYQINGVVYDSLGFSWVYFIPAIQLTAFGLLNFLFARDTPADAKFTYDPINLENNKNGANNSERAPLLSEGAKKEDAPAPKKSTPSLKYLLKTVFGNPIFIILCLIDICLGWNRDGVLGWYTEVLNARFNRSSSSNEYALASGGTTIAGMFGSLGAGILSDSLFHSRRTPVAFVFYIGLAATFIIMYFSTSSWYFAAVIGTISIWLNGLNGLITSTCAMDFAGSDATATAVGLLDGIQKIGSSASGLMGGILNPVKAVRADRDYITQDRFRLWVYSFLPPAAFAIGMLVTVLDRKAKNIPKDNAKPAVVAPSTPTLDTELSDTESNAGTSINAETN